MRSVVSAGLLEGVVEQAGFLMMMLSDLGQGFPAVTRDLSSSLVTESASPSFLLITWS